MRFEPQAYGETVAKILALDGAGERLMPLALGKCSSAEARERIGRSRREGAISRRPRPEGRAGGPLSLLLVPRRSARDRAKRGDSGRQLLARHHASAGAGRGQCRVLVPARGKTRRLPRPRTTRPRAFVRRIPMPACACRTAWDPFGSSISAKRRAREAASEPGDGGARDPARGVAIAVSPLCAR